MWFLAARTAFLAGVVVVWAAVFLRLTPSAFPSVGAYIVSFAPAIVGVCAWVVMECRELGLRRRVDADR